MTPFRHTITARSITCCSSRTFPGHCRAFRCSVAAPLSLGGGFCNSPAYRTAKCAARNGISSGRSRRGGIFSGNEFKRKSRSSRNFPSPGRLFQVPVARRDHPDIDLDGGRSPDPRKAAILENAEQRLLGLHGKVGDLVEEQGAPVRLFEPAGPACHGVGEGPLLVAEQFAFGPGQGVWRRN